MYTWDMAQPQIEALLEELRVGNKLCAELTDKNFALTAERDRLAAALVAQGEILEETREERDRLREQVKRLRGELDAARINLLARGMPVGSLTNTLILATLVATDVAP